MKEKIKKIILVIFLILIGIAVVCIGIKQGLTTALTLLFSGIVALFAGINYFLWEDSRKATQGNLLLNLNRDFFFNEKLYKVRKAIDKEKPIFENKGGEFVESDVDAYLCFFDLIEYLIQNGILDERFAKDNFCDWAEDADDNQEIKDYINSLKQEYPREKYPTGSYQRFEAFVKRCCI